MINIALALLFVFFATKTYGIWNRSEDIISKNPVVEKVNPRPAKRVVNRELPPVSYYDAVIKWCLFSPDRAEFIPEVPESAPEAPPEKMPGRKIVLFGVVMMKDEAMALVSNPEMKSGDQPELWVRSGDNLGIFKVTSIYKESILLTDGAKEYRIPLYDPSSPRRHSTAARTAEPLVMTTPSEPPKKDLPKPEKPKQEQLSDDQYEIVSTPFGETRRRRQ